MASIKVRFRPSTLSGRKGSIYYQIIHERSVRQLRTAYRVFPHEWDKLRSTISLEPNTPRLSLLLALHEQIRQETERLTKIIRRLDRNGLPYTATDVIRMFQRYTQEYSLFQFMETMIHRLRHNGKTRTAETYVSALNSFKRFRQDEDLMLDSLTSETMEAYEAWQRHRGLSPNTTSFYLRILRAVYNRAVEHDIIEQRHPFRHVYTGVDKTVKRALPLPIVKRIKRLDLSFSPALDYARDMFLLSFYLRGMSFIDMAFLRKSDLRNGYLNYRRRKTGKPLTIEWTVEMQLILDKYPKNPTRYLLPIIFDESSDEHRTYRNIGHRINYSLRKIASRVGLSQPLTLYVARHSWASAARAKGIPLSIISEGMGHESETTTQIYLASLSTSAVDRANSLILRSL